MVGSPLTMILLVAFNSSLFVFNSSVKKIIFRQIFRPDFYHHAGVAPFGAAVAGTHAVYYNLMRTACGRNNKSSRTHTKTIDTTSFYLCHKAIFSGRQILSTSGFYYDIVFGQSAWTGVPNVLLLQFLWFPSLYHCHTTTDTHPVRNVR